MLIGEEIVDEIGGLVFDFVKRRVDGDRKDLAQLINRLLLLRRGEDERWDLVFDDKEEVRVKLFLPLEDALLKRSNVRDVEKVKQVDDTWTLWRQRVHEALLCRRGCEDAPHTLLQHPLLLCWNQDRRTRSLRLARRCFEQRQATTSKMMMMERGCQFLLQDRRRKVGERR